MSTLTMLEPVRVVYCEGNVDGTIGGSYYSLLYLVKGLDRSKFAPIVVFHADNRLRDRFHQAGVDTIVWPRRSPVTFGSALAARVGVLATPALIAQKAVNFARRFVWQALEEAMFLRRVEARLLHLNNSILHNHDWMLAARMAGIPCVSHERGINSSYTSAARRWAKRVASIVCISDAVRSQLATHGVGCGNLVTIYNGFDPDEASIRIPAAELRLRHNLPLDAPVFVMAGNLKPWKGQEVIIRAMATVCRRHPAVRCLLVGGTSPSDCSYEQAMRRLAADLGVADRVVFVGYVDNVADYMNLATAVLHGSILPEPFGRVALEAMACRRAVIGTRAGGMAEIIDNEVSGLTVPPGDVEATARAMDRLLSNPDETRSMGERGYSRLLDRFPLTANTRATEILYEDLLHRESTASESRAANPRR